MGVVRSLYQDPYKPVLYNSPPLNVTEEQDKYIRQILSISTSDSRFAQKAYDSIHLVLMGGKAVTPVINSLNPNNATIGDPSFTLRVSGSNFDVGSKIIFAGVEEPTTLVSANEVSTGVNMSVWLGADIVSVQVQNADGTFSNTQTFEFKSLTRSAQSSDRFNQPPVSHTVPPPAISPSPTTVKTSK